MTRNQLFLILAILLLAAPVSAWYGTYGYRQLHNMTGSSAWAGDATNYAVEFTLLNTSAASTGSTIYTNGKTATDWSDFRFVGTDDSTVYNYWIENASQSSTGIRVWVNVPTITKTGTTQFYIYYNKSGDTTISDGDKVFPFFDDFGINTLNTTRWGGDSATIGITGGIATMSYPGGTTPKYLYGNMIFLQNYSVYVRDKISHSGYEQTQGFMNGSTLGDTWAMQYTDGSSTDYNRVWNQNGGASSYVTNAGWDRANYHVRKYMWANNHTKFYEDTTQRGTTITGNIPTKYMRPFWRTLSGGYAYTASVDWMFVRPYLPIEPAHGDYRAEEASSDTTPPSSITGLTNSTATCQQVLFNWTNPPESDFNHTYVLKDNVFFTNVSNASHSVTFTGLTGGTPVTFSSKTVDISGNMNGTFQNMTATPTACISPTANFTANVTSACVGDPIQFNDTSTGSPTIWGWLFGDTTGDSVQNPVHTYSAAGTFDVTLNATNAYGSNTTTKAGYITVSDCLAPTVDFTVNTTCGVVPLAVQFTDTSTGSPSSYSWLFGEGNTSAAQNPAFTYNVTGQFSVNHSATNAYGTAWNNKSYLIMAAVNGTYCTTGGGGNVTIESGSGGMLQDDSSIWAGAFVGVMSLLILFGMTMRR